MARTDASWPIRSLLTTSLLLSPSAGTKAALRQGLDLLGVEPGGLVAGHGLHQFFEDPGHGEDFLLADAQKIVVVGRAGDDGTGGVVQVGGFIDDHRRIARPGDDGPLGTSQSGSGHVRAAGHAQQANVAVIEDRLGRFQRRLANDRDQVVDADGGVNGLVEELGPVAGNLGPGRMRIADQGIPGRQNIDGVAGQGRQRMGHRRDDADDAERSELLEGDAVFAADRLRSRRNSTPGVFVAAVISFSTLCLSRPMRVSSNSSRPRISALSMQTLRMQATALRRPSRPRASNFCWAASAAATAWLTSSKTPQLSVGDARSG